MSLFAENNSHPMSYGSNRSVVRMIATRLPIDSGQRLYVQVPGSQISSPLVSVGGILDLTSSQDGTLISLLKDPELALTKATQRFRLNSIEEENEDNEENSQSKLAREKAEATERLSSLEEELSRLRSQIAMYTLMEESNAAAPPPPPPPPPPLPDSTTAEVEVIKEEEEKSNEQEIQPAPTNISHEISNVKLRKLDIQRSPGGTPLRPHPRQVSFKDSPSMDDPAAVIAHALRKKFSHRVFLDSPDKENLDQTTDSSFSDSPAGPSKRLFN